MKFFLHTCCLLVITSCVAQKPAAKKTPLQELLADTTFRSAHIGINVYDPVARKSVYNYNGGKYFVPASNVKIATCYAVMKYLKHILPGVRYYENDTAIYLVPTGDPSFLHRDFPVQPVFDFLKNQTKKKFISRIVTGKIRNSAKAGRGMILVMSTW